LVILDGTFKDLRFMFIFKYWIFSVMILALWAKSFILIDVVLIFLVFLIFLIFLRGSGVSNSTGNDSGPSVTILDNVSLIDDKSTYSWATFWCVADLELFDFFLEVFYLGLVVVFELIPFALGFLSDFKGLLFVHVEHEFLFLVELSILLNVEIGLIDFWLLLRQR